MKITKIILISLTALTFAGCGGKGSRPSSPSAPMNDIRASFLLDDARTSEMCLLSNTYDHNKFISVLNRKRANGDNSAWVYFANQGDYGCPVSFYQNNLIGGPVDMNKVNFMRDRLKIIWRDFRMAPTAWGIADDSGSLARSPHKAQLFTDIKTHFGDLLWPGLIVVGLEVNEWMSQGENAGLVGHIRGTFPGWRIGVHETTNHTGYCTSSGADICVFQFGFGKSEGQVVGMAKNMRARVGRPSIAGEYHRDSDSAKAKAIGNAVMGVPGIIGTGNGR